MTTPSSLPFPRPPLVLPRRLSCARFAVPRFAAPGFRCAWRPPAPAPRRATGAVAFDDPSLLTPYDEQMAISRRRRRRAPTWCGWTSSCRGSSVPPRTATCTTSRSWTALVAFARSMEIRILAVLNGTPGRDRRSARQARISRRAGSARLRTRRPTPGSRSRDGTRRFGRPRLGVLERARSRLHVSRDAGAVWAHAGRDLQGAGGRFGSRTGVSPESARGLPFQAGRRRRRALRDREHPSARNAAARRARRPRGSSAGGRCG